MSAIRTRNHLFIASTLIINYRLQYACMIYLYESLGQLSIVYFKPTMEYMGDLASPCINCLFLHPMQIIENNFPSLSSSYPSHFCGGRLWARARRRLCTTWRQRGPRAARAATMCLFFVSPADPRGGPNSGPH